LSDRRDRFRGRGQYNTTRAMVVEPDTPQRIARLTPVADVLARLDALVKPVTPRSAEPSAALGHALAEDIVIAAPIPAAARALRDGWAVPSHLTTDASGYAPAPLPFAVRTDVGEPLPGDADAVAPLDAVAVRDSTAQALGPVTPGEGVLPASADVAAGATLLAAGPRLGGVGIAIFTAGGGTPVGVRAPPLRLRPPQPSRDGRVA